MALPEPGTFAVHGGTTYPVASAAAETVTLRVPRDAGPLPGQVEGGTRRDGDLWAKVRKVDLERYFSRRVTVQWQGEEVGLGRVDGDAAEIHASSPVVADRLGLEGDQYNGFRATVPVDELSVVDVREEEIDV
ncbi:hypothetical protein [Nocardioides okcheonensis]|uniref:hypothetical protein n=1 Tax=Nocardioides okcheonensis TaxID=2894081 RepID=UPI001E5DB21D|nr:hypothetical protein [Nocardioides okcheonensis]UFN42705.1 hypothetical protein LN652_11585 [Nocardioides okcheonensis]